MHIDDIVDLYILVLRRALAEQDEGASAYSKFYIAGTREVVQRDLLSAIAKVLHAKGIFATSELESISFADAAKTHFLALCVPPSMRSWRRY